MFAIKAAFLPENILLPTAAHGYKVKLRVAKALKMLQGQQDRVFFSISVISYMGYLVSAPYSKRSTLRFLTAYSTITVHLALGPKKGQSYRGKPSADYEIHCFRAAWEELEQFFTCFQKASKELVKKVQHMLCCQKKVRHCCFEGNTPEKSS